MSGKNPMRKNKIKLLFLFSFLNFFMINNSIAEELWWCEKNVDKNMSMMIPVWILNDQKKLIFLDEVTVDGIVEKSSHDRHDFNIYELKDDHYSFVGKWGRLNLKGVFYNNRSKYPKNTLIYTIDTIGSFEYPCSQLRLIN